MEKLWPLALLLLFSLPVQANFQSTISGDCPSDYASVVSMPAPNQSYSNVAAPGFFEQNLCVSGVESVNVSTSCSSPDFYIHSNNTYSHFSNESSYSLEVCISDLETSIRSSCHSNETAYLSVSDAQNGHVAWPGHFDNQVCGLEKDQPDNTTLQLNLDSGSTVYIDDVNTQGPVKVAEFPYIARENPPLVRGIVARSMLEAESSSNKKQLELKTSSGNAHFFVPFTRGDHEDIEERQEAILDKEFLNLVNPAFGKNLPEKSVVKTILKREDINMTSRIRVGPGTYTIRIEKTGKKEVKIRQR